MLRFCKFSGSFPDGHSRNLRTTPITDIFSFPEGVRLREPSRYNCLNKSTDLFSPNLSLRNMMERLVDIILGDPGADGGGEGKSKRAEKYGTKEK